MGVVHKWRITNGVSLICRVIKGFWEEVSFYLSYWWKRLQKKTRGAEHKSQYNWLDQFEQSLDCSALRTIGTSVWVEHRVKEGVGLKTITKNVTV